MEQCHIQDVITQWHHIQDVITQWHHIQDVIMQWHHIQDVITQWHHVQPNGVISISIYEMFCKKSVTTESHGNLDR